METNKYELSLTQADPVMESYSKTTLAFRQIANHLLHPDDYPHSAKNYELIHTLYGLDETKADILSLLMTRRIGAECKIQISRPLHMDPRDVNREFDELIQAGMLSMKETVEYRYNVPCPSKVYSLTDEFRIAISEDKPLPVILERILRQPFIAAVKAMINLEEPEEPEQPEQTQESVNVQEALPNSTFNWHAGSNKKTVESENDRKNRLRFKRLASVEGLLKKYPKAPFTAAVHKHTAELSQTERLVFYAALGWFATHFCEPIDPINLPVEIREVFEANSKRLVAKGLLVHVYILDEREKKTADAKSVRIAPKCAELFHGMDSLADISIIAEFATFTPAADIEEKELFFPDGDSRGIHRLRSAADPERYDRIVSGLRENKVRTCVSALLYGPPGTGKTELARQIARESGRGIFITEAQKLNGIYVGEGAIHLRDLFQSYRYVCAVSAVSPILFIDEADGLLGKRLEVSRSAGDKDANTNQSVILDELNTLPGLLIATTNLIGSLDEAMLRRFMIKEEFHLPDAETRARIWKSKFPSLDDEQAASLAGQFAISGGLIDNVISKAVVDGILEDRAISADDLREYCKEESSGRSAANRIGFTNQKPKNTYRHEKDNA